METKTSLTTAQAQALVQVATNLNLTVAWDYNQQNLKSLLEQHLKDVELGLWWPQPEGFMAVTDGAAGRFGAFVDANQVELVQQDTSLRAVPNVDGALMAGIVSNRQTFGVALISSKSEDLSEATLRTILPQMGLARLATALSEEVAKRTSTDKITGLWNRQYFNERFREECERLVRSKETGSVAIIGLDNFGALSRTMPADEVNHLFSLVGQTVRNVIRQTDWAVRWDTNELLFYFPSTPAEASLEVLKRFGKRLIGSHAILEPLVGLSSTVETTSPRALIQLATRRLDLARKDGHRRVICYATPAHGLQFWRGDEK
ncbi:MAG: GGDEF domain-containing protein [Candidatus Sericytochromatia bacterium]|nr:GGDEF domain-containing protein [Candidatus Sericytochromatia bacterium]